MIQGWEEKKLGNVCELLNRGISPKYTEIDGVCVLNQKCIRNHSVSYEESRKHDESVKPVNLDRFIKLGDVLVNSTGTGTLGRVAQIREMPKEKTTVDSHVTIVRPKEGWFFPDFFGYMLIRIEEEIKKAGEGCGGQTELARSVLSEKFFVHYPKSISEQQRIVSILDQTFASITKVKENAQRNLQNAKELFENFLQNTFDNKGAGWGRMSLGDLATFRNGMNFTKSSKGEKIEIVGVKDFQNSFWVPLDDIESVTIDGSLNEIDYLKEGDIIAVRSNGNPVLIGRTLLAGNVSGKVSHSGFTIRIRLNSENILPVYLCHYLKTQKTRKELVDSGNGVGIKSLNQGSLSSLLIPFPKSIKEQKKIINNIDALSAETKRLEAIYQQKLLDLEELKKSVLQKAFNGEL